jgi:hypothetical protein
VASVSRPEISCLPPKNVHGGLAMEVLCRGLAEGIIAMSGMVMTDKTGWSSPISSLRHTE